MTATAAMPTLNLSASRIQKNLSPARLVEEALARKEGVLASNGALVCKTGDRTGRSPKDKHLENVSSYSDKIWWGAVNLPVTSEQFDNVRIVSAQAR